MKNEFVPYDISLDMKELGFNDPCMCKYNDNGSLLLGVPQYLKLNSIEGMYLGARGCTAPLYQQAFRWFRDEFQLIKQDYMFSQVEDYHAFIIYSSINGNIYDCCYNDKEEISGFGFKLYKESELACLKKLIEIVNQNKEDECT
jgi:hypothetical protein